MPVFAATYRYAAGSDAVRDDLRPAHREHLASFGGLRLAGPTADERGDGALLLVEADDAAAVDAWLDEDPFVTGGAVEHRSVAAWTVVLGSERQGWQPPA